MMVQVEFQFGLGDTVINVPTGKEGTVCDLWIDYDKVIWINVRTVTDMGDLRYNWLREEDVVAGP